MLVSKSLQIYTISLSKPQRHAKLDIYTDDQAVGRRMVLWLAVGAGVLFTLFLWKYPTFFRDARIGFINYKVRVGVDLGNSPITSRDGAPQWMSPKKQSSDY